MKRKENLSPKEVESLVLVIIDDSFRKNNLLYPA
jgi:hypothetical protein